MEPRKPLSRGRDQAMVPLWRGGIDEGLVRKGFLVCGPVPHIGMIAQELLGILAALTDPLARVAEPGARLLDHAGLDAEVDQFADTTDPLAIHDVEFDLAERRRHLVLHHLDARRVADDLVALLDL